MKRIKQYVVYALGVITLPIAAVLMLAQPAAAVSTLSVLSPATKIGNGELVRVPVRVACDAGQTAFLDVTLQQKKASGFGFANSITCNGSSQTLSVSVSKNSVKTFTKGNATVVANLFVCDPSFACATVTDEAVIRIK